MLTITILCIGKLKEPFYEQAVTEYCKRLSSHCKLTVEELPENRLSAAPSNTEIKASLKKEAVLLKDKIPKGAAVIAMCIEGKMISSPDFANMVDSFANRGYSKLCFLIGGSFGLDDDLKSEADYKLSMSPMTFPHHLARVMLLEQLYRGFQITAGTKYHK